MKKLDLNLEKLSVESFETDEARDVRGTVQGREAIEAVAGVSYLNVTICPTSCRCPNTQ